MNSEDRSVWVTGGNGFLGRHVARRFANAGAVVVGFGRRQWAASSQWGFSNWSAADALLPALRSALESRGAPDVIFHAAGSPTVGAAAADPEKAHRDTVGTVSDVLDLLQTATPTTVLLYPSSCAVYGNAHALPLSEVSEAAPISVYGKHKLEVEVLCGDAVASGLKAGLIRYFSLYGPGLRKQLLWELVRRARDGENPVTLGGTGEETRDFLHVEDAAKIAQAVADHLLDSGEQHAIVNGASGFPLSIRQVTEVASQVLDEGVTVTFSGRTREGDPTRLEADVSRLAALDAVPVRSPLEGIRSYFVWAQEDIARRRGE